MSNFIIGIVTIVGFIAATCLVVWQAVLYRRLGANEKLIRSKEDEIDRIEPDINARTSGHLVTEKQRVAQVKAAKVPLERELNRLKQERRFLLDKILFAKK